ncbi:MAG: nucleotidyltransferase domain-containing protein [Candidatus Falkowbacteria bacterium]
MNKTEIKKKIKQAIEKSPHKKDIKRVSIFGSYAYGKPHPKSDVDILIEFKKNASIGYFELSHIQRNFSKSIDKPVDLLTPRAISRFFRSSVIKKAQKIYENK